ncbi:MAG: D-alanyl-D-alanine carboxypeptidase/D-alanyl-D-alanine-endopeptidase, partial [Firmicutes bacterium]|nr:D-alanyl-D-alanine carboxypeptidase/D-alanyl-D-alanine-endopeptidase [Bacillota bacterium]
VPATAPSLTTRPQTRAEHIRSLNPSRNAPPRLARALMQSSACAQPTTALQAAWSRLAANVKLRHAAIAGYAYDITTGKVIAALHSDWRLTPASVNKLFTSAAALAELGPGFRYTTTVREGPQTSGQPPVLYLVGGGDPWLEADSGRQLNAIASAVAAHTHRIERVIGVTSEFSGPRLGTAWTEDDVTCSYTPNIRALTAERDEIGVTVTGANAGQPPSIQLFENDGGPVLNNYFHIVNHALTDSQSLDTLSVARTPGTNRIIVSGLIPSGQTVDRLLSVHGPALFATRLFAQLLRADGVTIAERSATGALPAHTKAMVIHRSVTLARYLQIQNTYSINLMAESLYRTLGAVRFGAGTPANAHAAVLAFLRKAHLSTAFDTVDGSGLSPLDAVSPQQVVALLAYAAHQPWFRVFEHSLIHIGHTKQCSFMCGLMDGTAANRHIWMKTGDLGNQWNESGYARAANGNLVAFSLFFDGLNASDFYQQAIGPEDAMAVSVADWPDRPAEQSPAGSRHRFANGQTTRGPVPPCVQPLLAAVGPLHRGDVIAISARTVRTGATVFAVHASTRLMPSLLPRVAVLADFLSHPAGPETTFHLAQANVALALHRLYRAAVPANPPTAALGSWPWEDFAPSGHAHPQGGTSAPTHLTHIAATADADLTPNTRTALVHALLCESSPALVLALTRALGAPVQTD